MRRILYILCVCVQWLLNSNAVLLTSSASESLVINDVKTFVDVSTQLANIEYRIAFVSTQDGLRSFIFNVSFDKVAYVSAIGKNINSAPLVRSNGHCEIYFKKPLFKNEKENIVVHVILTHVLKPYPARIKQDERHLILFAEPVSLVSPYVSLNHTCYVTIGRGSIESVTAPDNFELKNVSQLLVYSSKSPVQPLTTSFTKIHYQHIAPFLTVTQLYRTIEISHWGSIKVIEEISLVNSGAKLYGPYHRRLYNDGGRNRIKYFTTALPASATDILVYDEIGLVSSLTTKIKEDCVEIEFHPRFSLYGGWKIKYFLSYNLPSYEYLFNSENQYALKMRVIDHIFNDMVIDIAVVRIILPEGATQFSLHTPYHIKLVNETVYLSYLDATGRPVIVFSKTNMVEQHIQDFTLYYTFLKLKLLIEPFYIIMFIEVIFMFIITFLRFDFSLVKEDFITCENTTVLENSLLSKTKKKNH